MNYQKIYDNIINSAKQKNRVKHLGKYYEEHHILPRCLGGGEEKENKVLLTAREHYICHKLLTYIYIENRKIACAFHYMTFNKRGYKLTSRDYVYARELISLIPKSKETCEKISNSKKGKKRKEGSNSGLKNPMFGKYGKDNPNFGSKRSEESKEKMRGRIKSEEEIEKIRQSNKRMKKICPHCNKLIDHMNYKRWHGEKCKNKI